MALKFGEFVYFSTIPSQKVRFNQSIFTINDLWYFYAHCCCFRCIFNLKAGLLKTEDPLVFRKHRCIYFHPIWFISQYLFSWFEEKFAKTNRPKCFFGKVSEKNRLKDTHNPLKSFFFFEYSFWRFRFLENSIFLLS